MKKYLVIAVCLMVLVAPLSGCCTRIDPVTKTTTKSFANCLSTAQQLLCNPTDAQKAEAASVLQFLTSGVAIAGLVANVPITAAEVTIVFGMIQSGGCVLTTDLQLALAWYAALTATLQAKAMTAKDVKAMPPAVNALYVW